MPVGSKTIVLEDNFDAVRNAVTGALLMDAALAGGHVVEGHAKVNAGSGRPGLNIQTGTLVNSINVSAGKKTKTSAEALIGTNVVYARIHELGGIIKGAFGIPGSIVHMPARPYLRPGLDENTDEIVRAVKTEIKRNLDKASK